MSFVRVILCGLVSASVCAACTPALTDAEIESRLKEATASVLEVSPDSVKIIDPQATQSRRIWRAETGGKVYACDADRSFALPDCNEAS